MTRHLTLDRATRLALIYLVLTIGAIISLTPFLYAISGGLKEPGRVFTFPPTFIPDPVRWQNLIDIFHYVTPLAYLNSTIFAGTICVMQTLLGMMMGFAFARLRFPGREKLFLVVVSTLLVPFHIIMIPVYLVTHSFGWIDTYQGLIVPILGQLSLSSFMFRQYFLTVPQDLYDAGKVDGANPGQIFLHIYAPLAGPAVAAYVIITFLTAWNMYLWPLLVVSRAELSPVTLQLAVISAAAGATQPNIVMAASVVAVLPVLVVFLLAQRWFIAGITMSGVKG